MWLDFQPNMVKRGILLYRFYVCKKYEKKSVISLVTVGFYVIEIFQVRRSWHPFNTHD